MSSHYAGAFERELGTQVAGVRHARAHDDIHTVAAGGGSVLHFDGSVTASARTRPGAVPGPACYGAAAR